MRTGQSKYSILCSQTLPVLKMPPSPTICIPLTSIMITYLQHFSSFCFSKTRILNISSIHLVIKNCSNHSGTSWERGHTQNGIPKHPPFICDKFRSSGHITYLKYLSSFWLYQACILNMCNINLVINKLFIELHRESGDNLRTAYCVLKHPPFWKCPLPLLAYVFHWYES